MYEPGAGCPVQAGFAWAGISFLNLCTHPTKGRLGGAPADLSRWYWRMSMTVLTIENRLSYRPT